jgi:hypothetical protein
MTTTIADTSGNSQFSGFFLGGLDVGRGEGPFLSTLYPRLMTMELLPLMLI